MRKNEEDQGAKLVRYTVGVLLGGGAALLACALLLLAAALGISRGWLDGGLTYQITVVACVLGSFAGGVVAIRRCKARALLVGLAVGAVFFLLLLTVGVLFFETMTPEAGGIGLACGSLCGGAAAGILCGGGGKGGKGKKKRRK